MQLLSKVSLVLGAALLVAGQADAQGGRPGGGGGGDAGSLVRNPSVAKELKLTDEQLKKIPDAVLKALGEVLDADQLKRLKEIQLQQRGVQGLKDEKIQKALKLSGEQKDSIETIMADADKSRKQLFEGAKGDFKGMREKFETLRKETDEKALGVLNATQKKQWRELLGAEFKIETPGFRPGGAGGTPGQRPKLDRKEAPKQKDI